MLNDVRIYREKIRNNKNEIENNTNDLSKSNDSPPNHHSSFPVHFCFSFSCDDEATEVAPSVNMEDD